MGRHSSRSGSGSRRYPDKGLTGYERYVGLGILAYNLHKIGAGQLAQAAAAEEKERKRKRKPKKKAA